MALDCEPALPDAAVLEMERKLQNALKVGGICHMEASEATTPRAPG